MIDIVIYSEIFIFRVFNVLSVKTSEETSENRLNCVVRNDKVEGCVVEISLAISHTFSLHIRALDKNHISSACVVL